MSDDLRVNVKEFGIFYQEKFSENQRMIKLKLHKVCRRKNGLEHGPSNPVYSPYVLELKQPAKNSSK